MSDLTRAEAIKELTEHLNHWKRLMKEGICGKEEGERTIKSFELAIDSLKTDLTIKDAYDKGYKDGQEALAFHLELCKEETEPCEDCISRKALLEEIENGIKAGNYEEGYEEYPHINDMDDIIECIKYADSIQPKPKTDVLDKIRSEIELNRNEWIKGKDAEWHTYDRCLFIIDKYKAESEESNG